jgi:hypothetical protein
MNNLANESVNNIIMKVVMECSKHYGFNSEEAMIRLGLLKSNENEGKVVVDKVVVDKVVVVDKSKKEKEKRIPLPYNGEEDKNCCLGITLNHGLYTQCEKKRKENDLCETCDKQAKKNDSGKPDYGRMEDRQQVGWMEYRDPKGKKPIAYIKLMKKLGLTKEEVLKEAGKRKKKIDEMHFEEEEEEKKKGRPKKSVKVLEVEGETNDLFAELIASVNPNPNPNAKEEEKEEEKEKEKKLAATPRLEEEEVVAPVAVAVVKKEKVVKEKVLKEPKEKVLKEKVVKEKVLKEPKEKVEEKEKEEGEVEVEEEADVVKRFEYEGIKYLKSKKTGIIYNMEQDVVGKWNEETQKIDFETEEEDSEEEEEEYDE